MSGQAAKRWDQYDVDWGLTLLLGHTKKLRQVDPQLDADRAERRKKQQEISEKVKRLNEPGERGESIFCEIEDTCTTQESGQLHDGSGEDVEIGEMEMEMDFAGEKVEDTNKKIIPVKGERQTFVSEMTKETVDAAT